MTTPIGDPAVLDLPVAVELLTSTLPARLAYTWPDGTPRVVPIWFHWDGSTFRLATPATSPKVGALRANPAVALSIDSVTFPYRFLSVRGEAELIPADAVPSGYRAAAERYFGPEEGRAWVGQLAGIPMVEIVVVPRWANLIDFETRLPTALSG
jgi:PPOX class probable F420-dependent enzyme